MKTVETHRRPKRKSIPASAKRADVTAVGSLPHTRRAGAGDRQAVVTPQDRRQMIELAAYYRAERHGFSGGSAEQDWLEAEAEIDRALGRSVG
jgi:hypothetical protein